jgi:hypothetical protein
VFPHHFDVACPVANEQDVEGAMAEDLIGDITVFALEYRISGAQAAQIEAG